MNHSVKRFLLTTKLGALALLPYRARLSLFCMARRFGVALSWNFLSREISNYSYSISWRSKILLSQLAAQATGLDLQLARTIVCELDGVSGATVRRTIRERTALSAYRNSEDSFGLYEQRLLYYVFVRLLKPKIVVQSGTSRGVGAYLIALALHANYKEGGPLGRLITTDIDKDAGYVLKDGELCKTEVVIEDSVAVLGRINDIVDLYCHDSVAGPQLDREFGALMPLLGQRSIIISTWYSEQVENWAHEMNCRCYLWRDEPESHWYPGAAMAVLARKYA